MATRNRHKLHEITELLSGSSVEVVSLADIASDSLPGEESVETHEAFEGNALAKARFYRENTGMDVVADDSGLCVDALDGGPGVLSRRFCPTVDGSADEQDARNNEYLLQLLAGVPSAERGAHYRCALAMVANDMTLVLRGRVDGRIALRPRGHEGFGYDPLFIVAGGDRTFGELPPAVKASKSHRARAIRALRPWLGFLQPTGTVP